MVRPSAFYRTWTLDDSVKITRAIASFFRSGTTLSRAGVLCPTYNAQRSAWFPQFLAAVQIFRWISSALPAILTPNASTFTVIGPSTIFFVGAPGLLCEIPNVHTLERRRGDHNLHRAIPRLVVHFDDLFECRHQTIKRSPPPGKPGRASGVVPPGLGNMRRTGPNLTPGQAKGSLIPKVPRERPSE